jgi:hypothetical protein
MASITGLANIRSLIDKPKGNDGPKARWLKLEDGQSVKIRFLNEVDADSKSYNADNGLAIVVAEHTNPKDYRRKAACTLEEEGRCFGCEMHRRDPKAGWKARLRYYTNVMVDDGTEDPFVAIWSQGVGPKSPTTTTIIEYAGDTGSITNVMWRLKRTGTGTQTSYSLFPLATDDSAFSWDGVELYELEKAATRHVTYPDQESFFMGLDTDVTTTTSADW